MLIDEPDFQIPAPPGLAAQLREFARQRGSAPAGRVELHEPECSAPGGGTCTCKPVVMILTVDPRCNPERN